MTVAHEHVNIDTDGFDPVSMEIESTLLFLGVPAPETKEFMEIIKTSRAEVVNS